ncbi:HAD family hydrolase [Paracoccus tegillarcae]|uniref:HAD family hydrolase n=2 Tax=Paracoccus tegillarcae TaxID=1529068 RepID=A0A2K9EKJ2_9RHOB|nr:HAD family hydrolase [Paracoccus tegillarcae]AUH35568.1 HAD family hydrolase [Paracoccus tegillarcae]
MEWIGFDADDTLWENETFFRTTQAGFAELLNGYATPDRIAEHLYDTERRNLDLYGYGIKGFMLSMVQTALDLTDRQLPGAAIARILEMGQEMLAHPVHLIEGAADVVTGLTDHPRILITKGDVLDQERKIALSGLAQHFDAIEIVQHKTPEAYAAVFARHGIAADRFLMVGNSVNSDILPVLQAGGHAALVPHALTWALEQGDDPDHTRFHRLERITDVPGLIERLGC